MGTTSRSVFPDGSNIYVRDGTTKHEIASSTGALYHQDTILPIAPVGTTVQTTLEHKVLSNGCVWKVFADTTASASIQPYGLHIFSPTTSPQAYELPMPSTGGVELLLYTASANSTDTVTIATTAENMINGCEQNIIISTPGTMVRLVGLSTTLGWAVVSIGSTLGSTATTTLPSVTS
jgi:hypothetical protein